MFIYSKFSSFGAETPERLVHLLANEGIQALCLIDELGVGLHAFLYTCKKRNIRTSIAIPFSSFVEGREEKATGYFVVASYETYELVTRTIENMKQDFIPIFTVEQLNNWANQAIYCLIRTDDYYLECQSNARLSVVPVAYETKEKKEEAHLLENHMVGVSIEEAYFSPETVIFVEGVSRCPARFLEAMKPLQKTVNLCEYRTKREQMNLLNPHNWIARGKEDSFF